MSIKMFHLLLSFSVSLCVVVAIRRVWFHPLAKYPGPWLGKVSEILDYIAILRGSRTFRQNAILSQYGSPVRIGTDHLLYSDLGSWTDIYGPNSNPCTKDPKVYSGFTLLGRDNLLSATDRGVHGRLRRLLAHAFSLRGLAGSEGIIAEKVQRFVDVTVAQSIGEPVDILPRTYQLYLDVVSHLSFGESFDCLLDQNVSAPRDITYYFSVVPMLAFLPFLRHVPIRGIRDGLAGVNRLIEFSSRHVDEYLEKTSASEGQSPSGHLLHNLARATDPETGSKLSRDDIVEHSVLFLAAGSGTTSATLTFLLWECGRNESIRQRLAQEVRAMFPDVNVMPVFEKVSKLKFLPQIISETLRLWGPLNASGPRISPGKMISGRWVPKGTVVETNAYTTARDPAVFVNPLVFNPSRWESPTVAMKKMSRPFSYGPRNCIGQHLAEMALTLTVCRLYQLYDLMPTPEMTTEYMQQEDKGVLEPKNKHFYVTAFERGIVSVSTE